MGTVVFGLGLGLVPGLAWERFGLRRPTIIRNLFEVDRKDTPRYSCTVENKVRAKDRVLEIVQRQPDDVSFDDILRELAFVRMVERGLADADAGRVTAHADVVAESRTWRK